MRAVLLLALVSSSCVRAQTTPVPPAAPAANDARFAALCAVAGMQGMSVDVAEGDRMMVRTNFSTCVDPAAVNVLGVALDGVPVARESQELCGCGSGGFCNQCATGYLHRAHFAYVNGAVAPKRIDVTVALYGEPLSVVFGTGAYGVECQTSVALTCDGACTPRCANRTCGANGCGGVCGVCAAGQTCRTPVNDTSRFECVTTATTSPGCSACLSSCSGLSGCCTGCGCLCEDECGGCF
ncbi:MAG: hypothetical protein IT381_27935 [Deltaproteobacteria bacterium]|nr:hypothetical protein [Deltaproteobacteria bacterium]